ncbi:MAG: Heparinase II/III-like protein [Gemmatimonadetes bacterium]|nr:Heparinase II/III-like protein [Gemmatimonadota bacterium]
MPPSADPDTGMLTLTAARIVVNADATWSETFADEETGASLHRWNWLLRGLTDDPIPLSRQQGLALMRSWIRNCSSRPSLTTDAYSTGERIVNGTLFLMLTGDGTIPRDITEAMAWMARDVATNVEYHRPEQTGNHALNNARALLFAGLIAGAPAAVDLAYAICDERLPTLVTPDGFMREGSSHYHFLFTRWVLEMLWIAKRGVNDAFVRLLAPYAERLVRQCWFFLVSDKNRGDWTIPLFGDVSPDFPPSWLIGLPWSSLACDVYRPDRLSIGPLASGWECLFGAVTGTGSPEPRHDSFVSPSGWCRADAHGWTVFSRASSSDGALMAGHFHRDLGGIVVFHDGAPLITDVGRSDYTNSPISRYGISACAHSTILLDGLGAAADDATWMSGAYRAVQATIDVGGDKGQTLITLTHNGFTRFAGSVGLHERRIRLGPAELTVEDRIAGNGRHEACLRFHFAPGIELRNRPENGWTVGETGLQFRTGKLPNVLIQSGCAEPPHGGLFFPEYGLEQACQTLDLSGSVRLPVMLTHSLTLENI